LGHHRVCLAEQRLADYADGGALGERLDRGAQTRSPRADHEDVVLVRLVLFRHSRRRSRIAPQATERTYRSARPTEKRLIQAKIMCRSTRMVDHRHALPRARPKAVQEKQSSLPPARCRSEWQENV